MEGGKKALDEIKEAFASAKEWVPMIYIPSDHISEGADGSFDVSVMPEEDNGTAAMSKATVDIDIVKLTSLSTESKQKLQKSLMEDQKYPEHSLFRFDNYRGIEDKDKLKKFVFDAARKHGTDLTVRSLTKSKSPR